MSRFFARRRFRLKTFVDDHEETIPTLKSPPWAAAKEERRRQTREMRTDRGELPKIRSEGDLFATWNYWSATKWKDVAF